MLQTDPVKFNYLLPIVILCLLNPDVSRTQSIEEGIRDYKQQNYEKAVAIFSTLNSPRAKLFAGKSYYVLRRYNKAENVLNNLLDNTLPRIYYEAAYTSALVDFQQKQFGYALGKLHQVFENSQVEALNELARQLYRQILDYLTAKQRLNVIEVVDSDEIKYNLIESALGKVNYSSVKQLISKFHSSTDDSQWIQEVKEIESSLTNAPAYKIEYGSGYHSFNPPEGTIYNMGIALPKVNSENNAFGVIQGLYLGAKMAVDAFNDNHSDAKVYLSYLPTGSDDIDNLVETFANKKYGDFILGPLFSDQAREMVFVSAEYGVPVIAPLANAELKSSGTLFYQANPTFPVHGKMMAKYAMNNLKMSKFAVIASQNTSGARSAAAFREKVEALGGEVVYYFVKDLKANDFDISSFTKLFGSKPQPIDAIYAPFTGEKALYLIEQLASYTSTLQFPVTLLGSQKWADVNFASETNNSRAETYFTKGAHRSRSDRQLAVFQNRFRQTFNFRANQFAVLGYDVAHYLLQVLDETGNPALLSEALQGHPFYSGIVQNIYFNGTHVNHAVQIFKVGNDGRFIQQRWLN